MTISPAVIPASLQHLKAALERVGFASSVQIDVVDGRFAPHASWPYQPAGAAMEAAPLLFGRRAEIDLMVEDAAAAGAEWLQAGAAALVFHLESLADVKDALRLRDSFAFELGLSIGNDTPLSALYPHLPNADFVQLMGIARIGAQGEPFDRRVLERIKTLRAAHPDIAISVDGAVSRENILALKEAGADRFAVGSAILKSRDPEAAYAELLKIIAA